MAQGSRKVLSYIQTHRRGVDEVFPLLCPVREREWLDGWDCTIIFSRSGLVEQDCVFTTPHHGSSETVWQVTHYDPEKYVIAFNRVTPHENVVAIRIGLERSGDASCRSQIEYIYTGLSGEQNAYIESRLEREFITGMQWWERAINHYLETGTRLKRN